MKDNFHPKVGDEVWTTNECHLTPCVKKIKSIDKIQDPSNQKRYNKYIFDDDSFCFIEDIHSNQDKCLRSLATNLSRLITKSQESCFAVRMERIGEESRSIRIHDLRMLYLKYFSRNQFIEMLNAIEIIGKICEFHDYRLIEIKKAIELELGINNDF